MINFSTTFTDEQVRSLMGLMATKIVSLDESILAKTLTIYPNMRTGMKIGFTGSTFGYLGKAKTGCGMTASTNQLSTSESTWSPKLFGDELHECFIDVYDKMVIYAMNHGKSFEDLTNTDYFDFVMNFLPADILKAYFRILWFGDTEAALVTASVPGVFSIGTELGYFNLIDGFFRQGYDIATADSSRRTIIAANAQATYALQKSTMTNELAYNVFLSTFEDRSTVLDQMEDRITLSTNLLYKKAKRYIQDKSLPATFEFLQNGVEMLKIDGETIISVPYFDHVINASQNDGTKWNDPYRVFHFSKSALAAGMGNNGHLDSLKFWYDENSELNKIRFSDFIDAKILQSDLIQFAY